MKTLLRLMVVGLTLAIAPVAQAQDSKLSAFGNWFETANYGFSIGLAKSTLSKPNGFDIDQPYFFSGFEEEAGRYALIAYHKSRFHPNLFTRTQLTHNANVDFEGLKFNDTAVSHGYQLSTAGSNKVGAGISASASLGLIRTTSYRDHSSHLAAGIELSVFVRLYGVCLEAAAKVRAADSSTLDELSVNPSYRGTSINLLFWC